MAELAVRLTPMIEAAALTVDEPETDVDVTEDDTDAPREITAGPALAHRRRGPPERG